MHLVFAIIIGASPVERIAECRKIGDTEKRLACYDEIPSGVSAIGSQGPAANPALPQDKTIGPWHLAATQDPISDAVTHIAGQIAKEGGGARSTMIAIRCRGETWSAFIKWALFLGSEPTVTVRVDKHKPVVAKWHSNTQVTEAPAPEEFADALAEGKTLAIRVQSSVGTQTATFDLRRTGDVMAELRKRCGS